MPFFSNAHTHSTWCDGKDTIPDMIEAAKQLGFVSLGFSGHAFQSFHESYCMTKSKQRAYFDQLHALQPHHNGLRLWAGLEMDARADEAARELAAEADYIVGSCHYVSTFPDGSHVAVDGPPARLKTCVDTTFHGDGIAMIWQYYQIFVPFLQSEKPAIIGHFDLPRKHAAALGLFDERDPAYQRIVLDALEAVSTCGSVLELNTGGMARGYLSTPYPTLELLSAWHEMGGKVTITSDCHNHMLLAHAFAESEDLLRQAGFHSAVYLGTSEALWEEYAL